MQNSLSAEIVSLFDVVKNQAGEYSRLFELLSRKGGELERLRLQLHKELLSFHRERETVIEQFKTHEEELHSTFAERVAFVERVYGELERIERTSKVLAELRVGLESKSVELDAVLATIRSAVKGETEKEFLKLEGRVANKLFSFEGDIASFDGRLHSIHEFTRKETSTLSEEVDRFKSKIQDTRFIVEETTKIVNELVERTDQQFKNQLTKYSAMVDEKISEVMDSFDDAGEGDTLAGKMQFFSFERQAMQQRVTKLEKRMNTALWVAIVSIGIAVMCILLLATNN